MNRRVSNARDQLSKMYERRFTEDCRFKSLIGRLNRCSKEYSSSLFSGVTGCRISGYPSIRFDVTGVSTVVRNDFHMAWGGADGVDSELCQHTRDSILSEHPLVQKESHYHPKNDAIRILLGSEFNYCFNRREKRPRGATPSRNSSSKGMCDKLSVSVDHSSFDFHCKF